jgi:hypothetical protein
MADRNNPKIIPARKPNLDRHKSHCSICAHPQRTEIENAYVAWTSPAKIAAEYKLRDRSPVYRHALATGLDSRRRRNLGALLDRIMERVDDVPVTSAAIV